MATGGEHHHRARHCRSVALARIAPEGLNYSNNVPGCQLVSYTRYMNKLGINFAIFILFFGVALIEAFQKQNWLGAALFMALGGISLWADSRKS